MMNALANRRLPMLALAFILAAGALGGCADDDGDGNGSGSGAAALSCNAISFCTTWDANDAEVAAPAGRGGTIADGMYRVKRGTFSPGVYIFKGGAVLEVGDGFANRLGTYSTADGKISFAFQTRCDAMGTTGSTSEWKDRPYFVDGAKLFIAMADSFSNGMTILKWYEYERIEVETLCESTADFRCTVTNCSCAVKTNGFGTMESNGFCRVN